MLTMKAKDGSSRIGEIVAEMSSITEFAEGSIVSSSSYYTTKDGKRHKTRPQFKFQSRGGRGRQKLRHIPAALVPQVRRLIENGRRLEKLEAEYKALMTEESIERLKTSLRVFVDVLRFLPFQNTKRSKCVCAYSAKCRRN